MRCLVHELRARAHPPVSDQDRALRSAATATVELTAQELHPVGAEQAEHVAMVISQVFGHAGAGRAAERA